MVWDKNDRCVALLWQNDEIFYRNDGFYGSLLVCFMRYLWHIWLCINNNNHCQASLWNISYR